MDAVTHPELLELVRRSVAVVNTSTLEGMPNSFLEAWTQGIPVLTYEFDPDKIVEGRELGISRCGSWDAFVEGAQELWESRTDRSDVSERVRSYVASTHSVESIGARWAELVSGLRKRR